MNSQKRCTSIDYLFNSQKLLFFIPKNVEQKLLPTWRAHHLLRKNILHLHVQLKLSQNDYNSLFSFVFILLCHHETTALNVTAKCGSNS